jgi:hypothetical protein
MNLDELRQRLDTLDRRLLELINERQAASREIARVKRATGYPTRDYARERDVILGVRKNAAELEKMRSAGLLVWKVLDALKNMVAEGVSTYDLEVTAEKMITGAGARPAFKGYASPHDALQSSLWAANKGDVKALLASATGEMQKQMEEEIKGMSETEVSIRAMDGVTGMRSVRVVNREAQGDVTVVLTVEFESRTDIQTEKVVMKKVGNEWKLSGPER